MPDNRTAFVPRSAFRTDTYPICSSRRVIWWFDRNDTPEKRSILRVHPFGDPGNPLKGVFATRAPVRPNLIALTRCNVISVEGNIIEIDDIDAFDDTPILDIKRYIEGY